MPYADSLAMQCHLDEISKSVDAGAHGAGWHKAHDLIIPDNLSILFIPLYSPELNPVKNIWQYLRQNHLSNRVFETYETIVEARCEAWNKVIYWNTARLGEAVNQRKRAGLSVSSELLVHTSPLGWAHILFTGEYRWSKNDNSALA